MPAKQCFGATMPESCNHLEELMKEQRLIIERHIDKHKYYLHTDDRNKAVLDFIGQYRFIIREAFCDLCLESKTCEAYKEYLQRDPEIDEALKPR